MIVRGDEVVQEIFGPCEVCNDSFGGDNLRIWSSLIGLTGEIGGGIDWGNFD